MAEMAKDTPLGPFRERLGETYRRVEITEVIKLIDNLPLRRAPGADALPAEIYKKTRAPIPYIRGVRQCAKNWALPQGTTPGPPHPSAQDREKPTVTGIEKTHLTTVRHGQDHGKHTLPQSFGGH